MHCSVESDYAKLGVRVQGVMIHNGACYKSRAFGRACKRLGLKHMLKGLQAQQYITMYHRGTGNPHRAGPET
jgi:transposase InsO family protein